MLANQGSSWRISSKTVCSIFEETVRKFPEKIYFSTEKGETTYAQAHAMVADFAAEIEGQVLGKVVGIHLPNCASFLITYLSVLMAGGKPALINIATPPASVAKMLEGAEVAFVFSEQTIPGVATRHISDEDCFARSMTKGHDEITPAKARAEDTGVILFSGGTTGTPKRIVHSHKTLIAKMERMEWGWQTRENEIWLPVAPFSHIYGFLMGVVNPILKGAKLIIPARFKPELIVDLLARERVTFFGGGPPAIYQGLLAAENFPESDLSALRVCPGGGAPFPVATHEQWEAATGLKIHEGLGMTEIAPIAVNPVPHEPRHGTVGRPCPDTEIEIVDVEDGTRRMPAGESGEIRVRGPHMMDGYDGNPEETAATIRDGFIYTGDIGSLSEDGLLTITDRKKDVIIHKGFNVFPREVEETLMQHNDVDQVCVVGREDPRAGEVTVAFVAGAQTATATDIIEFCKARLSAYKVPGELHIIDNMPLTANGKLDRLALRDRASS